MRKGIASSIVLAICLVGAAASAEVGSGQGASGGGAATDSPYKNGPPPVTGAYTDTSQGGTKGSGDPAAMPPNVSASAAKNASQSKDDGGRAGTSSARGQSPDTSQK
jgi:hypothetical protein